jgi:uncharacterized integral membrane protein
VTVKVLSWLVGIPIALLAVLFAVSNRQAVVIDPWPLPWEVTIPLYLLVLGALAVGLVIGAVIAWLSAAGTRGRARRDHRRANRLEGELEQRRLKEGESPKALPSP